MVVYLYSCVFSVWYALYTHTLGVVLRCKWDKTLYVATCDAEGLPLQPVCVLWGLFAPVMHNQVVHIHIGWAALDHRGAGYVGGGVGTLVLLLFL